MMSSHLSNSTPAIRKLRRRDRPEITQHLLRLDDDTRRMRFGNAVSDGFVRTYAERVTGIQSVVFGAFPDGELRAIGELRGLYQSWPRNAEIAMSVEPDWQSQGLGTALFARLVEAAQNRNIKTLHVLFLTGNQRMNRIAARHRPGLEFQGRQVEATLDPPWPTPLSVAHEIMADTGAHVRRMFMLPT